MKKIIVTGGLGFIGSNLIDLLLKKNFYVINIDKATYSSNFYNTKDFTKNDWKGKNVLLFGSEGFGIKAKTLDKSDFRFKVNMSDKIESLNISNTVSVVCHHIFQSKK